MDSVVSRLPHPVLRLRHLSRRQGLAVLGALLVMGLGVVAAIREYVPRLVASTPPPLDVCGPIVGSTTWDATHTWVIEASCSAGVTVPFGSTLTLDGQRGPFAVLTHGPGITVQGGRLQTVNTSSTNTVSFDAEFDAATWPGLDITVDSASPPHRGTASLANVNIGSHLNLSSHPIWGIKIDSQATSLPGGFGLVLSSVNIFNASGDGIQALDTPISVSAGAIDDAGNNGIEATFTTALSGSGVTVNGVTVARAGSEGIHADLNAGQPASITANTVAQAGLFGIHLRNAASPTVLNNTITCSGHQDSIDCPGNRTRYPAIYLDDGSFDFSRIGQNQGSQNGLDALALHGTLVSDLTWVSPSDATILHPLGYLVDASLVVQARRLTVPTAGVVKVAGALIVDNGVLDAGAGGATFTSLDDNTPAGISQACPSVFLPSCPSPLGGSEWSGITLQGDATEPATAVFDSATVTHASTAVSINNNGWSFGPSTFGLIVRNGSVIQNASSDGIAAIDTPLSVDASTFAGIGAHAISASFLGPAPPSAGLSVSNHTLIQGTGNEGILGTALAGQPVHILNDLVSSAGAYGIRLEGAGEGGGSLALQGNVITASGTGSTPYPAMYLNGVRADFSTGVTGNTGNGNGLDAIVFHGTALGNLSWQTAAVNATPGLPLGYLLDSGLTFSGGRLIVHAGDVVKAARGGQITINGPYAVDGSDASSARLKVFTSLKDLSYGIPVCPATVLADCSSPRPGDWGGLNLLGGAGTTITNGLIRFASTGVAVDHGAPVILTSTSIDAPNSDAITAQSTPLSVTGGSFSRVGQHGINASMSGVTVPGTQLVITGVQFAGSGNEAILATSLNGHSVSIVNNTIDRALTFGINLQGADQVILQGNVVTGSGVGAGGPYPAIYLNGVTGDFANAITGNRGARNGLDALAFHGNVVTDLGWKTASQSTTVHDLGYLLDGDLTLGSGESLTVRAGDIVKAEGGAIHLNGGTLNANDTSGPGLKVFTSLSDNSQGVAACPSVLLTPCGRQPQPGDWGGLILTEDSAHDRAGGAVVNAWIRFAATAIAISSGATSSPGSSTYGLTMTRTRIGPTAADGISAQDTPVQLIDDSITGAGGHGLATDLLGTASSAGLLVRGVEIANTGAEGILASSLAARTVWISDSRIRNAGLFGLQLKDADHLVLRNTFICGSGAPSGSSAGCATGAVYPAVYLNTVTADLLHDVRGNLGASNGLDAIVLHGTVTDDLTWIDPVNSGASHALGYLLDAGLTINGNLTLTVHNATVKALGGGITLNGGTLDASGATFTSLADPAAGINLCPPGAQSPFLGCGKPPAAGDWGGIVVTSDALGHAGSATLVNSHIRYATTGIAIDNAAPAGLQLQGTEIGSTAADAISAQDTAIIVGDLGGQHSRIHDVGARGIDASFTGTTSAGGVTVRNAVFNQSGKEAVLANVLSGQAVSITGTTISNAGTYGIQLIGARVPVVFGNTLQTTGFTGASSGMHFPAIYLNGVTGADFTADVAGNVGNGNNLDAIAFHGSTGPLTWQTAHVNNPGDPLGYLLDGPLTIQGNFTVAGASTVRSVGGAITVGGNLLAGGGGAKLFTSLLDPVTPVACPSPIIKLTGCTPAAADWGGLIVQGSATLVSATVSYDDGLTVTGGALQFLGGAMHHIARNAIVVTGFPLSVSGVAFSQIGGDGIDALNTGAPSTVQDDRFDQVGGTAINLQNAPSDHVERNVFSRDGGPAIRSAGATVKILCSSIPSGGVVGDANLHVNESDFASTDGVTAPLGADVENNWWGQAPPGSQLSGGVTVTTFFASQKPTAAIALTDLPTGAQPLDPVRASGAFGTGQLQATLTFSRNMNQEPALPTVSDASSPVTIAGSWTSARTWVGTAPINAVLAVNGSHALSATGAHSCVPDPQLTLNNQMTPATQPFTVDATSRPTVTVSSADRPGAHSARLHGHIDPRGWATGSTHAGQFLLVNLASPFDQHTYPAPPLTDKTTPLDFTLVATGLTPASTYASQLVVPSVNGIATAATSDTVATTALASTLVFAAVGTPVTAGTSVTVTVTAEDPSSTPVSDYPGTVTFTSTDAQAVRPADSALTLGVGSFGVTLRTAGTQSLTATDTVNAAITGTLSGISVAPAAASQLAFSGFSTPGTVGTSNAFVLTANDAYGNPNPGYRGTVHFTSSDGHAVVPGDVTFTAPELGVHTGSAVTFLTSGTQTLTATDTAHPAITGTTSGVVVVAAATSTALISNVSPSAYGQSVTWTAIVHSTAPGGLDPQSEGAVTFEDAGSPLAACTGAALTGNTISCTLTVLAAGAHLLSAVYNGTGNYVTSTSLPLSQQINRAALIITADSGGKVYGAANPALSATPSGLVNGDTLPSIGVTPSVSTTVTTASPVGTYPITVSGPASTTNYTITYASGALTVTRAPLVVTADDQSRTYGSANPGFSVSYAGFVNGDTSVALGGVLAFSAPAASSPVGTYTGQIIPSGLSSPNYAISYVNGTLTISPAPLTIIVNDVSKLYGAANPAFSASYAGLVNGDTPSSLVGTLAFGAPAPTSPAGTYPGQIVPSGLSSSNYTITYANGTLTITPAPLTVAANNASKVYGAANPAFSVSYVELVNGDTAVSLGGVLAFSAPAASSPVGTYAGQIAPSGLSSPNYTISYVSGTLTITPAPLTVTANDASKVYGAPNPALTATATGLVNGDTLSSIGVTPALGTTAGTSSTVGSYPITVTGPASTTNYTITYASGTLTITPAPLMVTANDVSKVYGAPNPALTATATGLVNADTLSSIGVTPTVGTTATGASATGTDPITVTGPATTTNYTITYVSGTLTITPAPLMVTANDVSKVYGAPNPALTATATGLVNADTLSSIGATPTVGTTATSASSTGTYPITVTGPASTTNYTVTYVSGTLTITPAPLTVTANDASKVYGAANPAFSVSYAGFVDGDTPTFLGGSLGFSAPVPSSPVGTYTGQIVPSGLTSSNYTIGYVNGNLTVTPAPTVVSASASPEPSTAGSPDMLSATITSPAGLNPNNEGTVTFIDGATVLCTTGVLTGNGASCSYSAFAAATHSITATYNPSSNFTGSSTTFPHQVN